MADGPNIGRLQEAIQKRQAELAIVKLVTEALMLEDSVEVN